MTSFSIYAIPILVILLSIPLVMRKVPPNMAYGFRTSKTLSSPDIWYATNRAAGWYLIAASMFSICASTVAFVFLVPPDWLWDWLPAFTVGPLLVASLIYVRRFRN